MQAAPEARGVVEVEVSAGEHTGSEHCGPPKPASQMHELEELSQMPFLQKPAVLTQLGMAVGVAVTYAVVVSVTVCAPASAASARSSRSAPLVDIVRLFL